jgi:CheY-like chemotaxis protein
VTPRKPTLLLVDDEDDFRRAAAAALARRGFSVNEAPSGQLALAVMAREPPDVVVLDLKMPGMSGIDTLRRIRELDAKQPVLILTGHGSFPDALTGVNLGVVDFLQKPVDMELLTERLMKVLAGTQTAVRESSLAELMVPADLYPHLYADQTPEEAFAAVSQFVEETAAAGLGHEIRSALVFDRQEQLVGVVRFSDLLRLVLPRFLSDAPYPTFCAGMFVAQCKLMAGRSFCDLMAKLVTIDVRAPLMAAVHLMARHRLSALPLMDGKELVGILRDRAVVLEIARTVAESGDG